MSQILTKLLALVFVLALSVANSVGVMIIGYGIYPKNYWAIVIMGVFVNFALYKVIDVINKDIK